MKLRNKIGLIVLQPLRTSCIGCKQLLLPVSVRPSEVVGEQF